MKNTCALLILTILLTAAPFPVKADPASGTDGPASGTADSQERDLVQETLVQDIETAGYYELLSRCRELGLDDTGGRAELKSRLFSYYNVEPAEKPEEEEEAAPKKRLEIKSARKMEYFTIQEVDEDYIIVQGDVVIEVQDGESNHQISAQRIIINQTENILTAEGDLVYILRRGEEEEVFRGEKLTFNVETWEGVFFRGGVESEREVGGKELTFNFYGDNITKLENGTIVLDNGIITSDEPDEDPHYKIRAQKIWVLAPGEWAILHGVLYVGRIPVLYFPFFFLPGDEFFFHPVIGYKLREGNFLQTTSYLIGRKERTKSPISFLAATEEETDQYKREIRGLFLRQTEEEYVPPENESWFFKVMLDIYSRLGGFIGLAGDFSPYLTFKGGIGFSRNVYDLGTYYTPFELQGGRYISHWNRSWLFGIDLPFRYGLSSNWDTGSGDYRFYGKFELYSDPFFTSDFYNRAEDVDWSEMLGMAEETTEPSVVGEVMNYSWELSGQADFSKLSSTPFFKDLSIPNLDAKLYWQSKEKTPVKTNDPSPSRRFYYPVNFKLPSASLKIGGDLLDISAAGTKDTQPDSEKQSEAEPDEPGKGYRSPFEVERPEREKEEAEAGKAEGLRTPGLKEDARLKPSIEPDTFTLSYQIRPNLIMEQSFDTTSWNRPEDIDYEIDYSTLDTSGFSSLDYNLQLVNTILRLSGNLLYSGNYRTRFNYSYTGTNWETLVYGDSLYTRWDLKTTQDVNIYPFLDNDDFKNSTLSYGITWNFYRYVLNESAYVYGNPVYYGIGPEWNDQTVTKHVAAASLVYQPYDKPNTLSISSQLPPLAGRITGTLEFYVWLLRTTVNSVFKETNDVWAWEPLIIQEALNADGDINLEEELRWDLETNLLLKSISSLALWGFTASFTAERLRPVYFDAGSDEGWLETGGQERFLPSQFELGYALVKESMYLWKNRIRLGLTINSSWFMNLQKYTESNLDFTFGLTLRVYKFLDLSFTTVSSNDKMYRYFPGLPERVGEAWVNPLEDLARSFNFGNTADRRRSAFKLKSFSLSAVHHLHDWDLSLTYEGKPELVMDPTGKLQYEWQSSFTIFLQWIPIPELERQLKGDAEGLHLRG